MKKLIRSIAIVCFMLAAVVTLKPATAYADEELLASNKTNKLTLADTLDEGYKVIDEKLAVGKSVTYKINVPKGVLYLNIADFSHFTVKIYNSENEEIYKTESISNVLYGNITLASGGVELSKGKYKVKISPKNKKSELKLSGIVSMVKIGSNKTIELNKSYNFAVKKGTTYKFKFTVEDTNPDSRLSFDNIVQSYDANEWVPYIQEFKIVNSKGKTIEEYDSFDGPHPTSISDGTFTMVLKANKDGVLNLAVEFTRNNISS